MIKLPEEGSGLISEGRKLDVWVVSDGYLGMVYKVHGVEIPGAPKVLDYPMKEKRPEDKAAAGGSSGPA